MQKTKSIIPHNWKDLPRPAGYFLVSSEDNESTFVIEPLEKGYGTTLGNALRRIMLSSLQGVAVYAIKIEGVDHQFSTIEGVKEDVIEIILNLKSLVLSTQTAGKQTITLSAKGPCVVTAGMIKTTGDVEVMNPSLPICHIEKNAQINMEIHINSGKGYIPAEENKFDNMPFSTIPVDSIYSPVKRVIYKVENTRVGAKTEFDRLFLTIETNGAIKPDEALSLSAKIMQDQLNAFINVSDADFAEEDEEINELPFDKKLLTKLENIDLSVRCHNCLKNENIIYVGDLVTKTEESLLNTPNFGRKSLEDLKKWLEKSGLHLSMKVKGWPPKDLEELSRKYEQEQQFTGG